MNDCLVITEGGFLSGSIDVSFSYLNLVLHWELFVPFPESVVVNFIKTFKINHSAQAPVDESPCLFSVLVILS